MMSGQDGSTEFRADTADRTLWCATTQPHALGYHIHPPTIHMPRLPLLQQQWAYKFLNSIFKDHHILTPPNTQPAPLPPSKRHTCLTPVGVAEAAAAMVCTLLHHVAHHIARCNEQ